MKVVLLPGLDGTGMLFTPFVKTLPDDISTVIVSYPQNTKLSYGKLVEFVMSKLPNEKFILVGESFSGPIAYQVALRKPENLVSVIFVATFLHNPRPLVLGLSKLLPTRQILSMPIPSIIAKIFFLGLDADAQIIELFKQSINNTSANVLSFRLHEITELPKSHQPCQIRATYIQATDDKLVPNSCVENFKKYFANLTVFQVKGPHFILQSNPVACAEILINEMRLITTNTHQ